MALKTKSKRVWTDEQRQAAAERARVRFTKKPTVTIELHEPEAAGVGGVERNKSPEVQAIVDTMTPERKAKLASIQAVNIARLAQTKDGREALERLEQRHQVHPQDEAIRLADELAGKVDISTLPPKPIVREVPMKVPFRITGSVSGLCVSELGPCWCGEQRLKWHPICLRVRVHG